QDPSTPCIDKTNCAPGQEVTTAGDDVTDRTCADCADGTYSSEENAEVCVVWTECTAAQLEEQAGTDTTDAVCTDLEVLQVVTGAQHTCVRLNDGHVRCWGAGGQGQLGYGDAADRNAPPAENVGGLGFVTHLAAGENHTCAILQNSRVRCWGAGGDGQL